MKARLHLRNPTHMVEWPDNNTGQLQARAFRRSHPEFKRRKLRRVLQAWPEQVPCGVILPLT